MNLRDKIKNTKLIKSVKETLEDYKWIEEKEISSNAENGFSKMLLANGVRFCYTFGFPVEVFAKYLNKTTWGIKELRI